LTLHDPSTAQSYYEAALWTRDTFYSLLATHAEQAPDAQALRDGTNHLNWRELKAQVDAVADERVDVEIVPRLRALLHGERLRAGDIEQRGDMQPRPFGHLARRGLAKPEIAEERHQHRAAAFNPTGQGMADNLHLFGAGKIGDFAGEIAGIERGAREEIEID